MNSNFPEPCKEFHALLQPALIPRLPLPSFLKDQCDFGFFAFHSAAFPFASSLSPIRPSSHIRFVISQEKALA